MASWDDEDFDDVPAAPSNGPLTDKWEGEDEEVADAWDAEEDEEKKEASSAATAESKKRRKNLKDIIKEKEEKRLAELEKKKQEAEEQDEPDMTPEQIRQAQEESDLMLAKDAFGVVEPAISAVDKEKSIDHQDPKSVEDFDKLHCLIRDKLLKYEKSPHFPVFMENTFREVSVNQDAESLRKLSTMFAAMANEKVKQMKGKTKKKGAGKGKIATIRDNDFENDATPVYDEFDDFI